MKADIRGEEGARKENGSRRDDGKCTLESLNFEEKFLICAIRILSSEVMEIGDYLLKSGEGAKDCPLASILFSKTKLFRIIASGKFQSFPDSLDGSTSGIDIRRIREVYSEDELQKFISLLDGTGKVQGVYRIYGVEGENIDVLQLFHKSDLTASGFVGISLRGQQIVADVLQKEQAVFDSAYAYLCKKVPVLASILVDSKNARVILGKVQGKTAILMEELKPYLDIDSIRSSYEQRNPED